MEINFDHGGNVFAVARSLGVPPEDILDFSASINPLGPAPGVGEVLAASLGSLVHYPESDATGLREALARHHGLDAENICVANGSTELIYLIPLLVKGRRGLIAAPAFSEYARALARAGWEADFFPLRAEEGFDCSLEQLEARLKEGYELLFLCNPGNPTGRLYPRAMVEEVIALCRAAGTFLVLDEAFMDFCEEESAKGLVVSGDGVAVLRSMTKFFAVPGLRLGYAIASAAVTSRLAQAREPWSVNTVAQAAGLASLADRGYVRRTLEYVAAERALLGANLAAIPGLRPYPAAANYILVEITDGPPSGALQRRLLAERILIRDCGNFAGLGGRFFRVAVRTRRENERLAAALGAALKRSA